MLTVPTGPYVLQRCGHFHAKGYSCGAGHPLGGHLRAAGRLAGSDLVFLLGPESGFAKIADVVIALMGWHSWPETLALRKELEQASR